MRDVPEPDIAGTDAEECFEKQVNTTMAGALFSVLSRLPVTWHVLRRARRIAADLPDFPHTVPLPDPDTLYTWLEVLCETPHRHPRTTHNVWGVLPGQSEEVILVTSHHDSPFQGAAEDGAGVVQVLAQAWAHVPREHRPKTLVFVIDAGHFYGSIGAHGFAQTHKDILEKTRILLTLEHLVAKDVEAQREDYTDTSRPAFTVMFTTPNPSVVATVIRALKCKPARVIASIPSHSFDPVPTSDAMGYVMATSAPVISWFGCPYYHLDAQDTIDKIAKDELGPTCETVTELVKTHMVLP